VEIIIPCGWCFKHSPLDQWSQDRAAWAFPNLMPAGMEKPEVASKAYACPRCGSLSLIDLKEMRYGPLSGLCAHIPIAQSYRRSSYVITCRCGGRIQLYTTELGTCERCGKDFGVFGTRGGPKVIAIVDHRRDLA
jgi:ssDNA-binding Zn-finger/Zn-ribbon topoisomerase 1